MILNPSPTSQPFILIKERSSDKVSEVTFIFKISSRFPSGIVFFNSYLSWIENSNCCSLNIKSLNNSCKNKKLLFVMYSNRSYQPSRAVYSFKRASSLDPILDYSAALVKTSKITCIIILPCSPNWIWTTFCV